MAEILKLSEMTNGWFIGDFAPTCHRTVAFETACKKYLKGDQEAAHMHKIATEITLIAQGRARMGYHILETGNIIIVKPCEIFDFEALEDTLTFVIKTPSVLGDKYPISKSS